MTDQDIDWEQLAQTLHRSHGWVLSSDTAENARAVIAALAEQGFDVVRSDPCEHEWPLEGPDSEGYMFCTKCGTHLFG